jgi:hypothetical protein
MFFSTHEAYFPMKPFMISFFLTSHKIEAIPSPGQLSCLDRIPFFLFLPPFTLKGYRSDLPYIQY